MSNNSKSSQAIPHNSTNLEVDLPLQATVDSLQHAFEVRTTWKTNLMIASQAQRVKQRSQMFKKRTSFQEHLINDHLKKMKQALLLTGVHVKEVAFPLHDKMFYEQKTNKRIDYIENNIYLTEEQKWQFTELFLGNQQNFSILLRMSYIFLENIEELVYLLCHILNFVSISIGPKYKSQGKKEPLIQLMNNHRLKLIEAILNQPNIQNISPLFFSNENEKPLMEIINNWLYNILCIKLGIYEDMVNMQGQEEEMQIESQEEDLFA